MANLHNDMGVSVAPVFKIKIPRKTETAPSTASCIVLILTALRIVQ